MTESEWLASADGVPLLDFIRPAASDRKLLLFSCACARRFLPILWYEGRHEEEVGVVERFADGGATEAEVLKARCYWPWGFTFLPPGRAEPDDMAWCAPDRQAEVAAHAAFLRDIFGNPFRPRHPEPARADGSVAALAQAGYDERVLPSGELDPLRLAVLADALEEAGEEWWMVAHLRGPGPHVRGCHVIDALLGKG